MMRLSSVALLFGLGALVAALPAVADTSPVELVPVPWTQSDTGAPPLPLDTPQYALRIQIFAVCFQTGISGCPSEPEYPMIIVLDSGATVFDQSVGPFRVKGRVASSISTNVWTLGLKELRLTLPVLPSIGEPLEIGDVTNYSINIEVAAFAGFSIPFDGKNATTAIVTKLSGIGLSFQAWSDRLQSKGKGVPGDLLTSNLLAGDDMTISGYSGLPTINANIQYENVPPESPGGPMTYRVTAISEFRYPACLAGPEPTEGYDCSATLEIFTPRVVPSTLATTCASDINGDGIVNFGDLAKMKSVFLRSCTP